MVLTSDKERVKSLIQDTLSLLCRNGLNFNKQFCIEALVGVTIDEDDVFLVNIKETVKSDKAIEEERLAEEAARLAEEVRQRQEEDRANTSSPSQSVSSTSYSVKHAQRKRQRDSAANESDTVDSDMFDSYSEPSEKRSFMEAGNVKRERLEQEDEDELVFVKEEPREDNSFQDQYGGHPGPSWNNPLPPVSQYNTQSSSHDMLQHPPLPPGAAGDMQYPQTQGRMPMTQYMMPPQRKTYTLSHLKDALKMVQELGCKRGSIMNVAKKFNIPVSTLHAHVQRERRTKSVQEEGTNFSEQQTQNSSNQYSQIPSGQHKVLSDNSFRQFPADDQQPSHDHQQGQISSDQLLDDQYRSQMSGRNRELPGNQSSSLSHNPNPQPPIVLHSEPEDDHYMQHPNDPQKRVSDDQLGQYTEYEELTDKQYTQL